MFIPMAFVLFFHHHVNNDAYFFEKRSQYILSDFWEKSRTKSNTKEFQSTRDPREFKVSLLLLHQDIQCVFNTLISSYFIRYGHILRNFLLVYKTFDMFRVWVGKLFHDPIHDNSSFCFSSSFIKRSISSASN